MIPLLIRLVQLVGQILVILVIAEVILSYFMSPFNPIRVFLRRILEPMLAPIRRLLPNTGMIDFSPLVFIILVQIVEYVLISILRTL
jgi:YggT family protein